MGRHFNRSAGLNATGLPNGFDEGDDTPNFTIVQPTGAAPFELPTEYRPMQFLDDADLQP